MGGWGSVKKQDRVGRSTLYSVKTYRKVAVFQSMVWGQRMGRLFHGSEGGLRNRPAVCSLSSS